MSINNFDENVFWNTKSKTEKKAYYRHRLRKHLARELKSLHDGSRKLYKVRYEEATRIGTENLFIIKYEPSEKEHFHIYPPRYEECILHCHATCREILKGSDEWREYIRIEMNRYRQKFIRRYSGF